MTRFGVGLLACLAAAIVVATVWHLERAMRRSQPQPRIVTVSWQDAERVDSV